MSNNIYNILGKLNSIIGANKPAEPAKTTPIYESVAPKGDIMEAVKSLESKYATFKEGKLDDLRDAQAAKKEADADKFKVDKGEKSSKSTVVKGRAYGANKEEKDDLDESATTLSKGSKATYKDFAGETVNTTLQSGLTTDSQGKKGYYVGNGKTFIYANKVKPIKEGKLDDLRDARAEKDATANAWDKKDSKKSTAKVVQGQKYGGSKSKDEKDDLDEGKLDDLRDAQAEKKAKADAWDIKDKKEKPSSSRFIKGKASDAGRLPNQRPRHDDLEESNYNVRQDGDVWYATEKTPDGDKDIKRFDSAQDEYAADNARQYSNRMAAQKRTGRLEVEEGAGEDEVATVYRMADNEGLILEPGEITAAKRFGNKFKVVGYDGNEDQWLLGTFYVNADGKSGDFGGAPDATFETEEEAIAALNSLSEGVTSSPRGTKSTYNAGQRAIKNMQAAKKEREKQEQADKAKVTQEGVEFKDTIKNSQAKLTKAKKAVVKESRVMEETDYFYEKIGKSLAEKNPNLDLSSGQMMNYTSSSEFEMAVRKEMVAHGMDPNRARNILLMDEDFLSDVASSYSYYTKELTETMYDPSQSDIPAPTSVTPVTAPNRALDEIAKLAGVDRPLAPGAGSEDPLLELGDDDFPPPPPSDISRYGIDEDDQLGGSSKYNDFDEWLDAIAMATNDRYTLEQDGDTQHAYQTNDEGNSFYTPEELAGAWDDLERTGVVYESDDLTEEADTTTGWTLTNPVLASGTSRVGKLQPSASPEAVFGPKNASYGWVIEFDDGTIATVYEHKGEKWLVGGLDRNAFYKVDDAITAAGDTLVASKNEFTEAMESAQEAGEKDFEVEGQQYTVKEDINVNVTASGEEDALNLFRKLAGLAPTDVSTPQEVEFDAGIEEDREIEHRNTPREKVAPLSAAIPSGTDLNRSKKQDPATANRAANPFTQENEKVDEARVSALWNKYAGMLKGLVK